GSERSSPVACSGTAEPAVPSPVPPQSVRDDEDVGLPSSACVLVLVLTACGGESPTSQAALGTGTLLFAGNDRLRVQIADTTEERAQGLMNVTALQPDDGMAFVWAEPTTSTFWMKD